MATRTKLLYEGNGGAANGGVTWEYDWSDTSLKLLQVRCVNNSDFGCRGTLTSQSTGLQVGQLVAPHTNFLHDVSPSEANQFDLSLDARGRLLGVTHNIEFPA